MCLLHDFYRFPTTFIYVSRVAPRWIWKDSPGTCGTQCPRRGRRLIGGKLEWRSWPFGYGSIPINTIISGMNIHLPAILMFTRGTRFWHCHLSLDETFDFRRTSWSQFMIMYCMIWIWRRWTSLLVTSHRYMGKLRKIANEDRCSL